MRNLLILLLAVGCGSDANQATDDLAPAPDLAGTDLTAPPDLTTSAPDGMVHITGSAAKGPFISGVHVDVQGLDATTLNPLPGTLVAGQTLDNAGQFALDVFPGLNQIHVNGQFYQEISGTVSTGAQDLYAVVDLFASGNATVNLVTHLTSQRIKNLMLGGTSYDAAVLQAENELKAAVGGVDPGATGAQMSFLAGDTLPGAYLFALSAVFDREARIAGTATSLQEQINTVESDLAAGGTVNAGTLGLLRRAQVCVRPSDAMAKLRTRFATIGSTATVPDIDRALDSDLDGVPNAADTCLREPNPSPSASPAATVCASSIDVGQPGSAELASVHVLRSANLDGDGARDLIAIGPKGVASGPAPEVVVVWMGNGDGSFHAPKPALSLTAALGATNGLTLIQARIGNVDGDIHPDLVVSYALVGTAGVPSYPQLAYLPGDGAGGFGAPVAIQPVSDAFRCGTLPHCGPFQVCSGAPAMCVSDCRVDVCRDSETCDTGTGLCKCGSGADCSGGDKPYCVNGGCSLTPPCVVGDCPNRNVCDVGTGQCGCGAGGPCSGAQQCVGGSACIDDCTQPGQACPSGYTCSGTCRALCAGAPGGVCNADEVCSGGTTCVADCRLVLEGGCAGRGSCDPATGLCRCGGGAACGTATPWCVNGTCGVTQPCSYTGTAGTVLCQNGNLCDTATGRCYCGSPGGTCAGQCAAGLCQAVLCGGAYCNPGETCAGNACTCGSHAGCGGGLSVCDTSVEGGTCFPPCGLGYCGAGQVCLDGSCATQPYAGVLDFDLADFDGDGKLDIAGTVFSGVPGDYGYFTYPVARQARVAFLKGDGTGGFGAPQVSVVSAALSTDAVQLAVGDIDGTHHADLVLSLQKYRGGAPEAWSAAVLLNDGSGHFAAPDSASDLSGPYAGRVIAGLADADGNGVNDLYVLEGAASSFGTVAGQTLHVLIGDHAGHFTGGGSLGLSAGGSGYAFPGTSPYRYGDCDDARPAALTFVTSYGELGIGDLDGDGKADVIGQDAVFLSSGAGTFGPPGRIESLAAADLTPALSLSPSGYQSQPAVGGPVLVDLDGDGKLEVVMLTTNNAQPGMGPATPRVGRVNPPGVHTW